RYPQEFFKFYKNNLIYENAKPNDAHKALASLEKIGKLSAVITQNIDGLHQASGSVNVLELHGSVYRNYCTNCNKFFDMQDMLNLEGDIPYCDYCNSIIKPDVVLYEEPLNNAVVNQTVDALSKADLLIIGGTSLVVYPAASFIDYFNGDSIVLINKSNTGYDNKASLIINDSIGKVLSQAVLE
ncbi:MAG: NAD-dependent protein deacylase, partial [Erysipelotrichaceae bacterium]